MHCMEIKIITIEMIMCQESSHFHWKGYTSQESEQDALLLQNIFYTNTSWH